jgi:alkylated DNA repair dioxygenase AlkB
MRYARYTFCELFKLHPKEKHKIIMYNEEVAVNRWQQSYLKTPDHSKDLLERRSYMYSGFDTSNNNMKLPDQFNQFYDYMVSLDNKYNQVSINWYENKNDYIAYHADCEEGMIADAEISTLSLYDYEENYRTFSIIPSSRSVDYIYDSVNILAKQGMIITMGGDMQKYFKHGIKSEDNYKSPRISMSFRQFI